MPASPAAEEPRRTAIGRVYVSMESGHAGKLVVEWSTDEPFQELTLALGAPHILRILCMRHHLRVILRDSATHCRVICTGYGSTEPSKRPNLMHKTVLGKVLSECSGVTYFPVRARLACLCAIAAPVASSLLRRCVGCELVHRPSK